MHIGRPYTTIERNLVERMVSVILVTSAAFDPLGNHIPFQASGTNPRFATIASNQIGFGAADRYGRSVDSLS